MGIKKTDADGTKLGFAPFATIACGLLVVGRDIFLYRLHPGSKVLLAVRLGLAILFIAWGLSRLFAARHRSSRALVAWTFGSGRSAILIAWSALAAAADAFAGASPLVFVAGVTYSAVIGWDRIGRFLALDLSGFALVALAILASWRLGAFPFPADELLVAAVAAAVGIALARSVKSYVAPGRERLRSLERENKQLWDLSFRDALTGLYNRRFAQETGRIALSRAQRYHEQLHVFMIDIDHFKNVNDQLSHAVGDLVLKGVAQSIQACLRTSDSVSRYGGEEFLAFVVQAEAELAQFIANRIREAVASRKFAEVPWSVTISIGVASVQDDDDLESLIDRADKYLYYSKRGGRNKVSGF
jgi:diguanylate cyclase (GGDEF)-like protein